MVAVLNGFYPGFNRCFCFLLCVVLISLEGIHVKFSKFLKRKEVSRTLAVVMALLMFVSSLGSGWFSGSVAFAGVYGVVSSTSEQDSTGSFPLEKMLRSVELLDSDGNPVESGGDHAQRGRAHVSDRLDPARRRDGQGARVDKQ